MKYAHADLVNRSLLLTARNIRTVTEFDRYGDAVDYEAVPVTLINQAPSQFPTEPGSWIYNADRRGYDCSVCGKKLRKTRAKTLPRFCERCGSRLLPEGVMTP